MLRRPQRLRLSRDIERVYKQGRYGAAEHLSAKVLTYNGDVKRAVVVVAKKVSKKAVVRNRLRRQLLELLQQEWQQIRPGCDIVVTVRLDASSLTAAALGQELRQALTKSRALK